MRYTRLLEPGKPRRVARGTNYATVEVIGSGLIDVTWCRVGDHPKGFIATGQPWVTFANVEKADIWARCVGDNPVHFGVVIP